MPAGVKNLGGRYSCAVFYLHYSYWFLLRAKALLTADNYPTEHDFRDDLVVGGYLRIVDHEVFCLEACEGGQSFRHFFQEPELEIFWRLVFEISIFHSNNGMMMSNFNTINHLLAPHSHNTESLR